MKAPARTIDVPGLGEPHTNGCAIYILVDAERRDTDSFAAGWFLPEGTPHQVVHVISRWQGGEVRGYVLHDKTLTLRTPAYPADWPEIDAAVEVALGATVARGS